MLLFFFYLGLASVFALRILAMFTYVFHYCRDRDVSTLQDGGIARERREEDAIWEKRRPRWVWVAASDQPTIFLFSPWSK